MSLLHPITVGSLTLKNNVALAPMAGITDLPFRLIASQFGVGLTISEMMASNPAMRNSKKSRHRLQHDENIQPRAVQIVGNDPSIMADAARYNIDQGAEIIDINMGCPAKKICRKSAGSAILGDEKLVESILKTVVGASTVPVTLKIRTGLDLNQRNAREIARIAEDVGIQLLSIHGRTRADLFKGHAEYDTIADVCSALSIPVLANGDIFSAQKAAQVLKYTGASGIMIGRGAQGKPWIFREIIHFLETEKQLPAPTQFEMLTTFLSHLRLMHQFYAEPTNVRIARKHIGWYLASLSASKKFRQEMNTFESPQQQIDALEAYFSQWKDNPLNTACQDNYA